MMKEMLQKISPRCPVFGECGGCQFLDIAYEEELLLKERMLRELFFKASIPTDIILPIQPSPKEYHYRCRLDMKFLKIKSGEMFMGFSPARGFKVVEVEDCLIAMEPVASFLPQLKKQACEKIPVKYRNANLTVKTGDDGRVFWGGIGRRSLRMDPDDYLWTDIEGIRIFYSLDTFFQANLSILPQLMSVIRSIGILGQGKTFFDLYGGVGLFGLCFSKDVERVVLIEENIHSVGCARHNVVYNHIENMEIIEGRVEEKLPSVISGISHEHSIAMIDPPRAGLSKEARAILNTCLPGHLFYLSCNPQTLIRDLTELVNNAGWELVCAIPFDFFPRTRHLETLVLLKRS